MDPRHIVFLVFINLVWGAAPIVLKLGFAEVPPLTLIALRFMLLSAVLLPVTKWHAGRMRLVALIAITAGALQFAFFMSGVALAHDVSPIAIASQLNVPFATLLSIIYLGEVVRWRRWLGILLSVAGGLVVAFDARVVSYLDAFAIATVGAFIGAVSMVLMRQLKDVGTFEMQAWIAHISWPTLLVLSAIFESHQIEAVRQAGAMPWLAVVYTAFGSSLVAHGGFYWMLQRYEVSRLAPFLMLAPLFTIALGVAVLGDVLTSRMIIGGLVTLAGVAIITVRDRRVTQERIAP